jgi:hypothetical protein
MRPGALLLAALFVLAPLAGCLGAPSATAKDLVPRARALADAWSADAVLEGIVGVELKELPPVVRSALAQASAQGEADNPQAKLLQYTDDHVGDGRAGAWIFGFRSGGRELALIIDSSGAELARHEDAASGTPDRDVGDFAIDSDKAMDLAAAANATFARVRGSAGLASLVLVPGPAGPAWVLVLASGIEDMGGGEAAFAMVDASTGNVTTSDDVDSFGSWDGDSGQDAQPATARPSPYYHPRGNRTFVQTESGSFAGRLSVAAPDASESFDVEQAGHRQLRLQLDLPRALPSTSAKAVVTAPDGRTVDLAFTAAVGSSSFATAILDTPEPGAYHVALHLDSGVLQQYTFGWCAPGSRMASQDASSVCGEA